MTSAVITFVSVFPCRFFSYPAPAHSKLILIRANDCSARPRSSAAPGSVMRWRGKSIIGTRILVNRRNTAEHKQWQRVHLFSFIMQNYSERSNFGELVLQVWSLGGRSQWASVCAQWAQCAWLVVICSLIHSYRTPAIDDEVHNIHRATSDWSHGNIQSALMRPALPFDYVFGERWRADEQGAEEKPKILSGFRNSLNGLPW